MSVHDMQNRLELRDRADGTQGVYTLRDFKAGDLLLVGYIQKIIKQNERNAMQIGKDRFVLLAGLINCVNHCCSPNCGVKPNTNGGVDLIAMFDGHRNDEITYDYATQNYVMEFMSGECHCGAKTCRKQMTGWAGLSAKTKKSYGDFVAPYLVTLDTEMTVQSKERS